MPKPEERSEVVGADSSRPAPIYRPAEDSNAIKSQSIADPSQVELPKPEEQGNFVGARFIAPKEGTEPTSPASPSQLAAQTPKSPDYGYEKPATLPLAQVADIPPSQNVPIPNPALQPINVINPQIGPGSKAVEPPQLNSSVANNLPIPVAQPQIPPVPSK